MSEQPLQESARRSRAERVWLALSIANVWASGVSTAQHEWIAALIATFFAIVCWGMSSVRIMAIFDAEPER